MKPNGTIVLTAAELFTARLMLAGGDLFKYPVVWEKNRATCQMHAKAVVDVRDGPKGRPAKAST